MPLSESMQLIEKTWNHTQNQKKSYIFGDGQQAYYSQVLSILLTTERKLTAWQFLVVDLSQHS